MATALPNVDDLFGASPQPQATQPKAGGAVAGALPNVDSLFGAAPQDNWAAAGDRATQASIIRITNAFGENLKQGWGDQQFGYPETTEELRKAGVINDYNKGQVTLAGISNELLFRPAATLFEAATRSLSAGQQAIAGTLRQTAEEVGKIPVLGRYAAAIPGELSEMAGAPEGLLGIDTPHAIIARAQSAKVLEGEGQYFGTKQSLPITPEEQSSRIKAQAEASSQAEEANAPTPQIAPAQPTPTAVPPEPDVHAAARQIAPETFAKYDNLAARHDTYNRWLSELSEVRAASPKLVQAQSDIDAILQKVHGVEDRLTKNKAEEVSEIRGGMEDYLATDTPDMARVRSDMVKNYTEMNDLAPDVRAAYRKVGESIPQPAEELPEPVPAQESVPAVVPVEPQSVSTTPEGATAAAPSPPSLPGTQPSLGLPPVQNIAADVSRQLVIAGRPPEEANAAAALVQAHYEARAARFMGRAGSPEAIYTREGPSIKAGRGVVRAPEYAQGRGTLEQGGVSEEPGAVDDQGNALPQTIIPGAEASDRQRLAAEIAKREGRGKILPTKEQKGAGPLFDEKGREASPDKQGTLFQTKRGAITFDDAKATIKLFKSADASTFIHETGHQWLEELMRDAAGERAPADLKADAKTVHNWLGTKEGEDIPTRAHEKFARGFERYMMEGVAPTRGLASVFAKFKNWLTSIYKTVAALKAPITDDIRGVFDRFLTTNPERAIIAPERPIEAHLADMHEAEADLTPPEQIKPVADNADYEVRRLVKEKVPDVEPDIRAAEKTSGVASENAGVPGRANEAGPIRREEGNLAPSGTEPARDNANAAEGDKTRGKLGGAYGKVPRKPLSLSDFVKKNGGLKGDRGDVQAIIGGKNARGARALLRKNGVNIDDMVLKAWNSGYFPETQERPTIVDFLDKLDKDINVEPQFSEHDTDAVNAYHDAIARNGEIDRLADHLGIDAGKMTKAEFESAISEHMSLEDMAREDKARAESAVSEFADAEALSKEWAEAHEGGWEPDEIYHAGNPATLEDLEKQHGEERASNATAEGAGGAGAPGSAAGGEGEVQESGGPGGPVANPSGRASGQTGENFYGEPVTGPNERLKSPETAFVDKAGNIRLDNLNTSHDVDAVIREMAEENDQFQSVRGPVSDQQVLDLADAMALAPEDLDISRLRQEFSAPRIMAVRKLLVDTANNVHSLAGKASTGTDADVMAYMQARARLMMVQEYTSALTAESGRGLRAFRQLPGTAAAKSMVQIMGDLSAQKTLFQLRDEAAKVARLDSTRKAAGFIRDADKPGLGAMGLELFTNWLISGPLTHMGYSVGNTALALWKAVPETFGQAVAGSIREGITGKAGDRVYFAEIPSQLYGLVRGQRNGWRAGWDSLKSGQTMPLPSELAHGEFPEIAPAPVTPFTQTKAIPGVLGTAIRIPGERMVAPIHSYFRSIGYSQGIARIVTRAALDEGLPWGSDAYNARVAELSTQPLEWMMQQAASEATEQTLMGKGGDLTKRVSQLVNWEPNIPGLGPTRLLRFVDPFVHIASNIVEQSVVERSPLGFLSSAVRDDISGKNGGIARDTALAKIGVGTSLGIVAGGLAAEGFIMPSAPSDPKEAAMWRLVNGQPHSMRIGQTSYDLSRMGVLGFTMGIAADLYHAASMMGKDDVTQVAELLTHSFVQNFLDEGFMRGPSDMMKALDEPDTYGSSYLRRFAANLAVPYSVGSTQIARQIDPYARQARTIMDQIKSQVPWWSETLFPLRDIWGEPVPNREWLVTYQEKVANDPINQTMFNLGIAPARLERKVRGVPLSDKEYDDFQRMAGKLARMNVTTAIRSTPNFNRFTPATQEDLINKAIENGREQGRSLMMAHYPHIMMDATRAKLAPVHASQAARLSQ